MPTSRIVLLGICFLPTILFAQDEPPKSLDPEITIELFAESPQIKTPTGIDVDSRGRVFAIESNTHFRPDGYDGHPTDRLLLLTDTDDDGQCDNVQVFADGFTHAMSVAVRPEWLRDERGVRSDERKDENRNSLSSLVSTPSSLQLFLATRRAVWLLEDTDGDNVCDQRTKLAWLETPGDYPHNGLAGFAFDALGWMYFGFGENLGAEYKLYSREMTSVQPPTSAGEPLQPLTGKAEGGNIYRMRPDGTQLSHWATGFWNPHASCVDAFGRLFTVDNDPDSRPPCRLLHVIEGGDYGYRFRNGRKGLHPFTSWNGEVPGTLPMVAGTGEAPSGILAYEHDAFPEKYLGNLFVTSWGDHRIDRFVLKEKGASFESIAEPFITGGENFRPVGIALAPDGSMYCTDWVLRDYKLHGQGRVWRISCRSDSTAKQDGSQLASKNLGNRRLAAKKMAESANGRYELEQTLNDDKYPVRARIEALWAIAQIPKSVKDFRYLKTENDRRVAGAFDEVGVAFHHLGNEPQFHINRDPKLIPFRTNLVVTDRPLSNYPVASLAEYIVSELECCPEDDLFRFVEEALTRSDDPFVTHRLREVFRYADPNLPVEQIADSLQQEQFASESATEEVDARMATMFYLSLTDQGFRENEFVRIGLRSKWPTVRRIAVQWAAEQFSHTDLRPDVEAVLRSEPMTPDLFLATLAALDMLDGNPPAEFEKADVSKYIVPLLNDESTPDSVKVHGLRLLQPDAVKEHSDLIATLAKSDDQELTLEAVRTLALVDRWQAIDLARSQFQFRNPYAQASEHAIWLEYITLLGGVDPQTPRGDEARDNLVNQLIHRPDNKPPTLALDTRSASVIVRSLRGWQGDPQVQQAITAYHNAIGLFAVAHGSGPNEIWQQTILAWGEEPYPESFQKSVSFHQGIPQTDDTWETFLSESRPEDGTLGGAAQRGRTVFEHPNGPGCSKCHTVHGRGGNIGPDLSRIGATFTREKLIDSILNPSKEVSPQFTNWNMATSDGKVHTGMIVHENKGVTILGQPDGTTVTLDTIDIEVRSPQRTSVMPEKLEERMTVAEFRDLLEYLQSLE